MTAERLKEDGWSLLAFVLVYVANATYGVYECFERLADTAKRHTLEGVSEAAYLEWLGARGRRMRGE